MPIKFVWQKFNPRKDRSQLVWIVIGLISLIGGIISIVFAVLEHSKPHGVQGTIVRIDTSGPAKSGSEKGDIRVVWGFDIDNNVLGSSYLDTSIDAGSFQTIQIQQNLNKTAAARYIDVIAGDDEICVSAIFTTFPNGQTWHWYGDVGAACGQAWEYGSRTYTAPNGTHFKAKCVWMSATNARSTGIGKPESIALKQMKIDVMAYPHDVGPDQIANNTNMSCGFTIFSDQDQNPIAGVLPENSTAMSSSGNGISGISKPSSRSKSSAERLIISSSDQHSAAGLCESATSRGSDLVSTAEGLFCDMQSKAL